MYQSCSVTQRPHLPRVITSCDVKLSCLVRQVADNVISCMYSIYHMLGRGCCSALNYCGYIIQHDDVIKWKYFPCYWPFVRGIHRSPVNSPHKGQWRGALMFSLICVWINGWVNNCEAGDLRRYRAHYDVTVMSFSIHMLYSLEQSYGYDCHNVSEVILGLYSLSRRTDVLPHDLGKSRSREIGCYNDHIALNFDRHIGSVAAEVPVKFRSDWKNLNPNRAASRIHEILRYDVRPLSE